jgi:hypothetical protein
MRCGLLLLGWVLLLAVTVTAAAAASLLLLSGFASRRLGSCFSSLGSSFSSFSSALRCAFSSFNCFVGFVDRFLSSVKAERFTPSLSRSRRVCLYSTFRSLAHRLFLGFRSVLLLWLWLGFGGGIGVLCHNNEAANRRVFLLHRVCE